MSFKFLNVTSFTLCFFSYGFVQGCHFLPALRYRSRACSPASANLPLGRIRFSWLAILVRVFTLSCVFVFYLFTFCSAFFVWSFAPLFVWFVYSFTYLPHCACTINSAGTILIKIRLFTFVFPQPVPSVFLFIVPTEQFKACWPTRFFPVSIETASKIDEYVSLFVISGLHLFSLILLFCIFTDFIFIYFVLSIFLVPVFVFLRVAFSKGNLCSLSDYRGWVCHSLSLNSVLVFQVAFPWLGEDS